jgi:hypothetical protein
MPYLTGTWRTRREFLFTILAALTHHAGISGSPGRGADPPVGRRSARPPLKHALVSRQATVKFHPLASYGLIRGVMRGGVECG